MASKPSEPTPSTPSTAPDPTLLTTTDTSALSANTTKPNPTSEKRKAEVPPDPKLPPGATSPNSRKRARKHTTSQTPTVPLPRSQWTYIHLSLITLESQPPPLDILTARTYLSSALAQFLGHTGAAIPVDVLRADEAAREIWVRVPREDGSAVVAACGGWTSAKSNVGWKVRGWGDWLGGVVYGGKDGGLGLFKGG